MKYNLILKIAYLFFAFSAAVTAQDSKGYFDYSYSNDSGQLILEIPENRIGEEFLYVNSLAAGVGSNDIGLDRGQLGTERLVSFYRSGNKILLMERNLKFRAVSDNQDEVNSVNEAFAQSVVWGFKILNSEADIIKIDLTSFLLRDAHGVSSTLERSKQGSYKLDKTKSAIYKENLLNFPNNTEFESILTFVGQAKGEYIRSVAADPNAVSVRQHHSFIRLPDEGYKPRVFSPDCGYFLASYYDYAAPIDEDIVKRFITRHRLEKKNPEMEISEAVEPIVYYLDRGCPEPIRSALIEGAQWWNEAFEAAGFVNAFQVKVLPEGAHPLDVRYNMIQWVHRSTRGWSYGSSVVDPRTGEIIKGHVSLGSLRVRQDYMIAQGIVSNFDKNKNDSRMLDLALARLRQLSAHEVGHTIGLAHNFAASYNDRASVMDYPHPLIELMADNNINFEKSYDVGIGDWDKRSIIYGYGSAYGTQSEETYLKSVLTENDKMGFLFITDQDARPAGGIHPYAHLWDNGNDPVGELKRIGKLRAYSLKNMGSGTLPEGVPYSELEKKLVPVYLMHRYQVDAASKIIGGVDFSYNLKGEKTKAVEPLGVEMQKAALDALLETIQPEYLEIPKDLLQMISPPAFGYSRDRETFKGHTGSLFDHMGAAEASANHTLKFLLNAQRLSRLSNFNLKDFSLGQYFASLSTHIFGARNGNVQIIKMIQKLYFIHLMKISSSSNLSKDVVAHALFEMDQIKSKYLSNTKMNAHAFYLKKMSEDFLNDPDDYKLPEIPSLPPGSPIGCH